MGVPRETQAVKVWLKKLRTDHGYTQEDLAARVGVSTRTVINAESPSAGLPSGLTMIRLLRVLGVLVDAPVAIEPARSLESRLEALEVLVGQLPTQMELREGLDTLREAILPVASQGTHGEVSGE